MSKAVSIITLARDRANALAKALEGIPCQLERDEVRARVYADSGGDRVQALEAVERIAAAFGLHRTDAERDRGELGKLTRRVTARWRIDGGLTVEIDELAELAGTAPSLLRRHRAEGRLAAQGGSSGRGNAACVQAAEARKWIAVYEKERRITMYDIAYLTAKDSIGFHGLRFRIEDIDILRDQRDTLIKAERFRGSKAFRAFWLIDDEGTELPGTRVMV